MDDTSPRLIVIVDRVSTEDDPRWLRLAATLPALPIGVQLRATGVPHRQALLRSTTARGRWVQLNGSPEEARELGFALHLCEARVAGFERTDETWVTAAAHDLAAIRRAEAAGVDAVLFSPVFRPSTKPVPGVGLGALAEATASTSLPVYALGGITPERVAACLDAGAVGVAVVSAVLAAADPEAAVTALLDLLG